MGRKIGQNSLRSPLGGEQHDPAPGYRSRTSGALGGVGGEGSVWSASANGMGSFCLRFVMDAAQPGNSSSRADGFQLRCLSE